MSWKDKTKKYAYDARYMARPEVKRQRAAYMREYKRRKQAEQFQLGPDVIERIESGPCEICGLRGTMAIDHDHATGKFRGLLCNGCNLGLGCFKDKSDILRKAAEYLEETTNY